MAQLLTKLQLFSRLAEVRERFLSDSLFRNATYLMSSTAIMSVLGFLFWLFVAHLYSPASIGVASVLISVSTIISYFSLLGLNASLIRFLAGSKNPSSDINAAALIIAVVTILVAAGYAFVGTRLGGNATLLGGVWQKLAFIILMSAVSLNSLTDAVFIANRRGEYHTIGYATFGLVKLLLPLALVKLGALGIYSAYILAMLASLIVSYYLMRRGCNYRLFTKPDWSLLKSIRRYTTHNYIGVVLAALPAQLMPQLIIKDLGPSAVAFFSMAWTMVNLLYVIPSAVTQSLLAESSFNPSKQAEHLKRTLKLLAYTLVPAVFISIIVAPYLLNVFGSQYRQNGTIIFQILAFATFFFAISTVGSTILNIERRTGGIIVAQALTVLITGIAAVVLMPLGLQGVGLALLLGGMAGSAVHAVLYLLHHRRIVVPRDTTKPGEKVIKEFLDLYALRNATIGADLGGGNQSITTLVTCKGRGYILKIVSSKKRSHDTVEIMNDFTNFLMQNNIPVPHIIPTGGGVTVPEVTENDTTWIGTLMKFEQGAHDKQYGNPLLKNMAEIQANIHVAGIAYASEHASSAALLGATSLKSKMLAYAPKGFGHFDYHHSNILVQGHQVTCVLDFEGLRYDRIVGCIYFTLVDIFSRNRSTSQLESYLTAYQRIRKLNIMEKIILRAALVVKFGNPKLLLISF